MKAFVVMEVDTGDDAFSIVYQGKGLPLLTPKQRALLEEVSLKVISHEPCE